MSDNPSLARERERVYGAALSALSALVAAEDAVDQLDAQLDRVADKVGFLIDTDKLPKGESEFPRDYGTSDMPGVFALLRKIVAGIQADFKHPELD